MRILKKILRIITILLPVFACVLISHDSFASSYLYDYLPIYTPNLYNPLTESYELAPNSWTTTSSISGNSVNALNSYFITQTRTYHSNFPTCDEVSTSVPYTSSSSTSTARINRINFTGYLPSNLSSGSCNVIGSTPYWYDYSAMRIADFTPSLKTPSSNINIYYSGDDISSASTSAIISTHNGLKVNDFIKNIIYDDLFLHDEEYIQGFSIPLYTDYTFKGSYDSPEQRYKTHRAGIVFRFDILPNEDEFAAGNTSKFTYADDSTLQSAFTMRYWWPKSTNGVYSLVSDITTCSVLSIDDTIFSINCDLPDYTGPIIDGITYNTPVFDGKFPMYFQFNWPDGVIGVDNPASDLFFQRIYIYIDENYPERIQEFDGTVPVVVDGKNPTSAPTGNLNTGEVSFLSLFNFNLLNPFYPIFGLFKDHNTCVDIPVIGSMINLPVADRHICPIYPATVYNIATPVIGIFVNVLLISYAVKFMRDEETVNINIKAVGGVKPKVSK